MGQLLSRPSDSITALRHLPTGVAALIASSPEYLERFRYMTRGEQVKALSKLATNLIVTFGTAGGSTRTLTRVLGGLEASVPVLSAEGLFVVERVVVPVGKVATVLSAGPGAAPGRRHRRSAPGGRKSLPPLPTPVRIESVEDKGTIIVLTPEQLTVGNPEHIELAQRVHELLNRAGLLRPVIS